MIMDKAFFLCATIFVISFAFGNGRSIRDPVFHCLFETSDAAETCYRAAHNPAGLQRGRSLGLAMKSLLPTDIDNWPSMNNSQKAQKCLTSLKNFMAPLEVVMASLKRPHFNCKSSGNTLNKTVHGLHQLLETAIKDINIYARRQSISLKPFKLTSVDMTRMTALAKRQLKLSGLSASRAVVVRNYVFLDYLNEVVSDIKLTPRSCFNTKVQLSQICPV
ncbi:uncharacterized protein LOC113676481 [Pocillopora damicornis]|nr:uncharacterized protein LOC113676481 [Pocillopora damicornis]